MQKGLRTAVYDRALGVEAYRFQGLAEPFPSHFHPHYVIGYIEAGARTLSCGDRTYAVGPGDVLLFHPGDSHACAQRDGGALDYRGLNIPREVMLSLAEETAERRELPGFSKNVLSDGETAASLAQLHQMVLEAAPGREERLRSLLALLTGKYGQPLRQEPPAYREEVAAACAFLEAHYGEPIRLEEICRRAGLSKSTLLRAFARAKGVTPYSYLENIRVNEAKRLLAEGVPPAEAALRTGFSDQSHLTHCFRRFTGLVPGLCRDVFAAAGQPSKRTEK